MYKFLQILLIVCLAVALCSAEAPRFRKNARLQTARRNRFLARQEVAPVTPYPSADELKPEVPFEDVDAVPAEEPAAPGVIDEEESASNQPDLIYGPPEFDVEESVPADADNELPAEPDLPAEEPAIIEEEEQQAAEEAAAESARLIAARRSALRKSARPAKLRAPIKAKPARLQAVHPQLLQQQQFVQMPAFYYTAQLQNLQNW